MAAGRYNSEYATFPSIFLCEASLMSENDLTDRADSVRQRLLQLRDSL